LGQSLLTRRASYQDASRTSTYSVRISNTRIYQLINKRVLFNRIVESTSFSEILV